MGVDPTLGASRFIPIGPRFSSFATFGAQNRGRGKQIGPQERTDRHYTGHGATLVATICMIGKMYSREWTEKVKHSPMIAKCIHIHVNGQNKPSLLRKKPRMKTKSVNHSPVNQERDRHTGT